MEKRPGDIAVGQWNYKNHGFVNTVVTTDSSSAIIIMGAPVIVPTLFVFLVFWPPPANPLQIMLCQDSVWRRRRWVTGPSGEEHRND